MLKLQPYDITIKYAPDSQVPVADTLSYVNPSGRTDIKGLDVTTHEISPDLSHIEVETTGSRIRPNITTCYAAANGGLAITCETGAKRPQAILAIER